MTSIRASIIDVLAATKPDLLTPAERSQVKDKSLLRLMIEHQVDGGRMPAPPAVPGAPDWGHGLPEPLRRQLAESGEHLRRMVGAGMDITGAVAEIAEVVHPLVRDRILDFYRYYDQPEANRKPFDARIDREDLLRLDGHDQTASEIMASVDTDVLLTGLVDRIDESAPAHERKSREERERPNSERNDLREDIENSHFAHELFGNDDGITDASEAFRAQSPSVRSSIKAVDAYLSEKGEQ
jgi:hypothetical protein